MFADITDSDVNVRQKINVDKLKKNDFQRHYCAREISF